MALTRFTITYLVLCITIQVQGKPNSSAKFNLLKACLNSKGINTNSVLIPRNLTSPAYVDSNFQHNYCCGGLITPMSYLIVSKVTEIQAAVLCCKQFNIRIVPKSIGHSYGKYSFGDSESLVLDLRPMNNVIVDRTSKTAIVGPGTVIGNLAYKLYKQGGFGIPFSECVIIGITYALGGGYGQFSRLPGLASDNLIELEMVDANGRILVANNLTNSDLFWALRGAGAGSFGIVSNYKFKLFDMLKFIIFGSVEYSISEFPQVFDAYQKYLQSNPPRTISPYIQIPKKSMNVGHKIVVYIFQHQSSLGAGTFGEREVRNIFTTIFPTSKHANISIRSMAPMEFVLQFGFINGLRNDNITNSDQLGNVTGYDYSGRAVFRRKSLIVPRTKGILDQTGILKLQKLLMMKSAENVAISFESFGGSINDMKPNDTAYIHRSQALYELRASFSGTKEQEQFALPWLRLLFEATKPWFKHTASLQNHLDIDLPDYLERYYGKNLQCLVEIKKKYDPENVFNNPQSIPTKLNIHL